MVATENSTPATAVADAGTNAHLSTDGLAAALTQFEISLIRCHEAFSSWAFELQKHASGIRLSFPDIALLHCVRLRGGATTLAEMLMFLHRHDLAAVQYGLRKLEAQGLLKRNRVTARREVAYSITPAGVAATVEYGRARQQLLVALCHETVGMQGSLVDATAVLERLIGMYDRAMQSILTHDLFVQAHSSPKSETSFPDGSPTTPAPGKPTNGTRTAKAGTRR